MLGAGAYVALQVFEGRRPSFPCDGVGVFLILCELGVDVLCYLGEGDTGVLSPEEVVGCEVVAFFASSLGPGWCAGDVFGGFDSDAVKTHVKNVVDEGLVGPGVGEHGDQVDVAV